jgi:hypothetical protein
MLIRTTEGDRNVASTGVAGTALGLGIAGTVGLLNQWAGSGGFFGNSNRSGVCGTAAAVGAVDAVATTDTRQMGQLESKIAKLEAERYTDGVGIDLYRQIISQANAAEEKIRNNFAELTRKVAEMDKDIAVERQATTDNFAYLDKKIDYTKQNVIEYCDATFVPGKLVMPLTSVCPKPMKRYNAWEAPTNDDD